MILLETHDNPDKMATFAGDSTGIYFPKSLAGYHIMGLLHLPYTFTIKEHQHSGKYTVRPMVWLLLFVGLER